MNLRDYDIIVLSTSGGKDSQAMLSHVHQLATAAGVAGRLVAVHADLGQVEWEGTLELAREQARLLGIRFEVVSRIGETAQRGGKTYAKGEEFGDILDYTRRRGAWPSPTNRWCTSDFKRAPIRKLHTALAREFKQAHPDHRGPVRILDGMGLRAQESPGRAKKPVLEVTNSTRNQEVTSWLPIHDWTEEQVWSEIRRSGLPHHRAYDVGMPRLSCAFCIFAPKAALVRAGHHNRKLLQKYLRVEQETGHLFRQDCSIQDVVTAVEAGEGAEPAALAGWTM